MKPKLLILIIGLLVLSWWLIHRPPGRPSPAHPRSPGALTLITEPQAGLDPVLGLIRGARSSLELVMYQFEDTTVAAALVEARRRGVRVRVLLNHGYRGQADPTNEPAYAFLLAHGVAVKWTPGLFDLTHQKSLEADGRVLLIMTFNLTPRYYVSGREFGVFDHDLADIQASQAVFEADWHGLRRPNPTGDGLVWSPGSEAILVGLIDRAHTSLDIYNEEMADDRITMALEDAARRGVRVRVCMTYASGWKEAFIRLSQAGIQVHTYASKALLYIHAKAIIVDDQRAFVGSENFSPPSLESNRELGLVTNDLSVITQLAQTFAGDFAGARPF